MKFFQVAVRKKLFSNKLFEMTKMKVFAKKFLNSSSIDQFKFESSDFDTWQESCISKNWNR